MPSHWDGPKSSKSRQSGYFSESNVECCVFRKCPYIAVER